MLVGAAFSWAGGRIAERVPLTVSVGVTSLIAAAALVVGPSLPGLLLPVLVLLVVAGVPELVYVTLSTYLQHNTRSEFRATSMSIAEGFFSIQMLWLFPLVGYLNAHRGLDVRLRRVRGDVVGGGGDVHRLSAPVRPRAGGRSGADCGVG